MFHKFLLFVPVSIIWLYTVNIRRLLLSFCGALIFAFLEMIHYKLSENKFFTTKEQFIGNLICIPFMIEDYHGLINNIYLRCLMFPFNIWFFEIVMGYSLIFLLGGNPAWNYNSRYSFFHGQISLECYPRWVFLGILQEVLYSYCFNQMF